nr:helix-turn-helix domain-containing protein [Rhizobium leguminosarum]
MAKQCPLWEFEAINFEQHVVDYRRHLWLEVERQGSPARAYVRARCEELGVPYAAIMGRTRVRKVSDLRQLLMWEVHSKFGLSYPAIGRMFGGRDHTTALYSVSKIEAERNSEASVAQEFIARKILMREKAHQYRELARSRVGADV